MHVEKLRFHLQSWQMRFRRGAVPSTEEATPLENRTECE